MPRKKKNRKIDSKETGLVIGLYFFKYFLKSEYLHYGFFKDGLEADIANFKQAQKNYESFLISNIPEDVKTILDVGCGSGKMAFELTQKGYDVECVSPSNMMNEYARDMLGDKADVHTKRFQDFTTDKKYDLVIFSESFQYIPMQESLQKSVEFLKPRGYIMISDFFQTDAPGKSPLGGGHKFKEWLEIKKDYPLSTVKEQDITDNTAPTLDIINSFTLDVLQPMWKHLFLLLDDKYPRIMKFAKWKFRKKINKLEYKHFRGERNAVNFKKYKKYMMYLFQLNS